MKAQFHLCCLILSCLLAATNLVDAQGTAFTYQGSLTANAGPANGNFDFTFALFNGSDGSVQVSPTLTNAAVQVTNGVFTTTLDFGSNSPAIFNGSNLWLEVGVRTNGVTNAFTTLAPLQPLTPTPYAITAGNLSGPLAASQLNGILPNNVFPATLPTVSGANLTNLPAANLTGSLPAISGANLTGLNAAQITNGVLPYTNGGNGFTAILNVRNYGARGDGINDDSIAIRNCIQSAATNGSAVVYIPSGTYLLNTTNGTTDVDAFTMNCIFDPTNNTLIYGDGMDRTILRVGNSVIAQSPVFHLATGVTNVSLRGMTVDCNVAGRGIANEIYGYDGVTWFNFASNIHIADMKSINTGGEGFDTGYSSFVTVERCIAIGAQGSGFTFSGPNGIIRDCQVYGSGYGEESFDTTRHWGAGLTIAYGAANMLVENCQFITNCMNVQVFAGGGVKINNCYFQPATYNTNYDLYLNPVNGPIRDIRVTGCNFNDSTANLPAWASYGVNGFQFLNNFCTGGQLLMDSTTSAQVLDNKFNAYASSGTAIVLTNSTVAEVANNFFMQNGAVPIVAYSPNNFIQNNVFSYCFGMIDIESSGNTILGNTSDDGIGYYDIYLNGSTNWILNNALASAVRFGSASPTQNQVINNTGAAALLWDTAATGNTFAFNNFPAGPVQSGNTYFANLQGQPASGTTDFDTLNVNTANIGTLTVGNALAPSALPYRAGTASISDLSTSQIVAFSSPFPASVGASYRVAITFGSTLSSTVSASVTSKTANGFTITLNTGIAGGVNVDWTAFPDN